MGKIDMTYANYKICKTNIGTSNKDLLSRFAKRNSKSTKLQYATARILLTALVKIWKNISFSKRLSYKW